MTRSHTVGRLLHDASARASARRRYRRAEREWADALAHAGTREARHELEVIHEAQR